MGKEYTDKELSEFASAVSLGSVIDVMYSDRVKVIQKECHELVGAIMKSSKEVRYQDATNVFLFKKIALIEMKIEALFEIAKQK